MADQNFKTKNGVTVGNNAFYVDAALIRAAMGSNAPRATLDLGYKTDAMVVPNGLSAERPATPTNGMLRFNSTIGEFEGYSTALGGWSTLSLTGSSVNANFLNSQPASYYTNASNLDDGIIPDARQPARLQVIAALVTDWNDAVDSGFYRGTGTNTPNSPTATQVQGYVSKFSATASYQFVAEINSPFTAWERTKAGGTWRPWTQVMHRIDQLDARFLQSSTLTPQLVLNKLLEVDTDTSGLNAQFLGSQPASYYLPQSLYTADDVLIKLLTVDTDTSGLNSQYLGSQPAAYYANASSVALKANNASPALTGVPTAPTAAVGTATTQLATTQFVVSNDDSRKANVISPAFSGVPTAPTANAGTSTLQLATTEYVRTNDDTRKANLAGGAAFTGPVSIGGVFTVDGGTTSKIVLKDSDHTSMSVIADANLMYFGNEAATDTYMRIATTGAIWTKEFGDLNTRINTQASSYANSAAASAANAAEARSFPRSGGTINGATVVSGSFGATGTVRVGQGGTSSTLYMDDNDHTNMAIHVNSNTMYFTNQAVNDHYMYVSTSGAIWSKQMGDISTYVNNQANAYSANKVARGGDTMSGDLIIGKSNPIVGFNHGGVKYWQILGGTDARLSFRDGGSGAVHVSFSPDGNVNTSTYGTADGWQESRTYSIREIRSVSQASSPWSTVGNNTNLAAPGGAHLIGVYGAANNQSERPIQGIFYKYLQGYSLSRGWFTISIQ